MVELPGSLERCTLGDILGALHRERVTGALRLDELGAGGARSHVIHWRDGLIYHIESPRSLGAARRPSTDQRWRVSGSWTVEDPAKRQRLEQLEALFELTAARISFRVMGLRPARSGEPLVPAEFLHGRRRRRDSAPPNVAPPPPADARPRRQENTRERALATLGLSGEPDSAAVRAAFRQLARRWHPDRYPHAGEQTRAALCRRFAEISTAYTALMARCARAPGGFSAEPERPTR